MKTVIFILMLAVVLSVGAAAGQGDKAMDMMKNIQWLGHDSFRITAAGKLIYIDPLEVEDPQKADIILVTHEHYDHFSPKDIEALSRNKTLVISTAAVMEKLKGNTKAMKPGDVYEADGIKIEAVAAYNTNKKFHPKTDNKLGFIITADGVRIYHAGDTDKIPEMEGYKPDIALLPVSGTYVMTAEEAAEAAKALNPKVAVPMHYGKIVGASADAERFKKLLEGSVQVVIMKKEK